MAKGYISFILHAHLPFVKHPERDDVLEEKWLFEAISETYIPLLNVYESLLNEGVDYRVAMSLTPPLLSMMADPLLQNRYLNYLERLIELTEREIIRTKSQPEFECLSMMYNKKYKNDLYTYKEKYHCDLISAFKKFQDAGKLEIIACAATHGFLPLMTSTPESLKVQIHLGVKNYERYFHKKPKGIWLPECGYVREVEKFLKENEIEYTILESHGILYASPKPVFGTYAPIVSPNGIVAFGRDADTSRQVWSADEGYPGDPCYRDFYRDIGFDLNYDYIRNYICPDGQRTYTGIKYYRITAKSNYKEPYNSQWAHNKANVHAEDFLVKRIRQVEYLRSKMDIPPIIVCPYDAELFGHWWYEGPQWLHSLLKKIYYNQNGLRMVTPGEYLSENPIMQVSSPCASSWGHKGYNEFWLNDANEWIYRHLHKASGRMVELANQNRHAEGVVKKALNQAARELLLAQSSDWAFIMKAGTMSQYAVKRTNDHITRFTKLYHDIKEGIIDESWLNDVEYMDNIFPEMDYRVYGGTEN